MSERLSFIKEKIGNNLEADFVGLSPEQQKRIKTHIESIGLPTENIARVEYKQGKEGMENVLGSYQPYDGVLTLYKSLDNLSSAAQHSTIVHEVSHSISPFDPKNDHLYRSNEAIENAQKHAVAVAEQSKITRKYLNGYQAKLHQQLEAGEIDDLRFVEETRAISMELRFTNPNHLKQVESAQIEMIGKIKKTNPNKSNLQGISILEGVDKTISVLIPQLKSKEDIDRHVNRLKTNLTAQKKPILPNLNLPKAA